MSSLLEFFYSSNPWWEKKRVSPSFRRPIYYGLLEWILGRDTADSLILLGPRRTGKTIILHQAAETLIENGASVAYIPMDELVELGLGRLIDAVEFYMKNLRESEKVVFLLDEVQYYDNWAREVKVLVDRFRRHKENVAFVCTGSSALGIMIGAGEALVGRTGIIRAYPMSPLEVVGFLENRNLSRWIWNNRIFIAKNALIKPNIVLMRIYEELGSKIVDRIQRVLRDILYWGSLIEIVRAFSENPNEVEIRRRLLEIIDLTILRDILRIQKLYGSKYELSPGEASKIIKTSIILSPYITSINDLSTRLGINKEKVKLAIKLAEYAGLIGVMKQYAISPMTMARKKKIKIHAMDVGQRIALKNISRRAYIGNNEEIGKNTENFVISRLYPILHALGDPNPKVYFWQRKIRGKTHEIDAITHIQEETIAIEAKKKQTKNKSLKELEKTIKRKITIKLENPQSIIPLAIL